MEELNLYTPQELLDKFPHLAEHGWNSAKIGTLFAMGLLMGRHVNEQPLITLKSFLNFVEFYNSVGNSKVPINK